jgi:hypothetical protein
MLHNLSQELQIFYLNSTIHLLFTMSSEHCYLLYLIKILYVNIYGYLNLLALSYVALSYFFYYGFIFFIWIDVRLRQGQASYFVIILPPP